MFSQTVEYALRAMTFVASCSDEAVTGEWIAAATQVPAGYLSKVMRDLVVAGLVTSQRGPRGGFCLDRTPDTISIMDIVNAVDPIRRITECPLGNPAHVRLCPLHQRLDNAMAEIERTLSRTTLGEILRDGDRRTDGSTLCPGFTQAVGGPNAPPPPTT